MTDEGMSDREISRAYAERTRSLGISQSVAADYLGADQKTMSNWRKDRVPETLPDGWREKILLFLENGAVVLPEIARAEGYEAFVPDPKPQADATAGSGSFVLELWRRLEDIDSHPEWSERAKLIRREHTLAAVREVTQNCEARAAEIRARAIELEAEAANGRAHPPPPPNAEVVTGEDARLDSMRELLRVELGQMMEQLRRDQAG